MLGATHAYAYSSYLWKQLIRIGDHMPFGLRALWNNDLALTDTVMSLAEEHPAAAIAQANPAGYTSGPAAEAADSQDVFSSRLDRAAP